MKSIFETQLNSYFEKKMETIENGILEKTESQWLQSPLKRPRKVHTQTVVKKKRDLKMYASENVWKQFEKTDEIHWIDYAYSK